MTGEQLSLGLDLAKALANRPPSGRTLDQARQDLRESLSKGIRCPCCEQFAKAYRSSFRWTAAYALLLLVRLRRSRHVYDPTWSFHLASSLQDCAIADDRRRAALLGGGGPATALTHWRLIEPVLSSPATGAKSAGEYTLTEEGLTFAEGRSRIPRYVYTYNGRVLGFGGKQIDVREALGLRFDYEAVMGDAAEAV
jgi:hypothetical protein